jgi:hypothetical protein
MHQQAIKWFDKFSEPFSPGEWEGFLPEGLLISKRLPCPVRSQVDCLRLGQEQFAWFNGFGKDRLAPSVLY